MNGPINTLPPASPPAAQKTLWIAIAVLVVVAALAAWWYAIQRSGGPESTTGVPAPAAEPATDLSAAEDEFVRDLEPVSPGTSASDIDRDIQETTDLDVELEALERELQGL